MNDMLDNTARQLDMMQPEPTPAAPKAAPTPQQAPQAAPKHVPFSPLERLATLALGLIMVGFCLFYLTGQMTLANMDRSYQQVQRNITTSKHDIADAKQNIGELSNSNRLTSYAKAHGFTVIEGNIKRAVNK